MAFMTSIAGTSDPDFIDGTEDADSILGLEGDDNLNGLGADDHLDGGEGEDFLTGGAGNDTLDGGAHVWGDWVSYAGESAAVSVDLLSGTASGASSGLDTLISIENVWGSAFNDTIVGDAGNNRLLGDGGDDELDGGDGFDTLDYFNAGGAVHVDLGAGLVSGAAGNDLVSNFENVGGSEFDDTIVGGANGEFLFGNDGNDLIEGRDGDDNLFGGAGSDAVGGGEGHDHVDGGDGDDFLTGGSGNDTLNGGTQTWGDWASYAGEAAAVVVDLSAGLATGDSTGTDTLISVENVWGSSFNDTLVGDAGNNLLLGDQGDDDLDGGAGFDTLSYFNAAGAVHVDLSSGEVSGAAGNDQVRNFERVEASAHDDTIVGGASGEFLLGLGGHDLIFGGDGGDCLEGGSGDDSLHGGDGFDVVSYADAPDAVSVNLEEGLASGGAGNDVVTGFELVEGSEFGDTLVGSASEDHLHGGAGDDSISGGDGDDLLSGGAGNDTLVGGSAVWGDSVTFEYEAASVTVDLAAGVASGTSSGADTLFEIEHVTGSSHDDSIIGSASENSLFGGGGNDYLSGGGGSDWLIGGAGDDTLVGGDDGENSDYAVYGWETAGVEVNLGAGQASGASAGVDTLVGIERVWGSDHNDTIVGDDQANILHGNGGDDAIAGGMGDDNLDGADGNDTLNGGEGADWLIGGAGNDSLVGGSGGPDTANFNDSNASVIIDLAAGRAEGSSSGIDTLVSIENVFGSHSDDTIIGDDGDNGIDANGGNDLVRGGGGNDWLNGGDGSDHLEGGVGNDVLSGGAGDDTLDGGESAPVRGGEVGGGDWAEYRDAGAVHVNLVDGKAIGTTTGIDTLIGIEHVGGSDYNDTIFGDGGANEIYGNRGHDSLHGGLGRDSVTGGDGNDFVSGGEEDDFLSGGSGNDTIDGGGQVWADWVAYGDESAAVHVDLSAGTATGASTGTDRLISIETVWGSEFNDTITGDGGINEILGGGGDDQLDGGEGTFDTVSYFKASGAVLVDLGAGYASGAAGRDTLANFERVRGTDYNDTIIGSEAQDYLMGAGGNDILHGAGGADWAVYNDATAAVFIDLSLGMTSGSASGVDSLVSIENARGSAYADRIIGNAEANSLRGDDGNDTIDGGLGDDSMSGGMGNDVFLVNSASDVVVELVGQGTDTVSATISYSLVDTDGSGASGGNVENLTLSGTAAINGTGNTLNNVLRGNAANNVLNGGAGADTMIGGAGNDTYYVDNVGDVVTETSATGGTDTIISTLARALAAYEENLTLAGTAAINGVGNAQANLMIGNGAQNVLNSGAGNDTLNGGAGADSMYGGLGNDTYYVDHASDYVAESASAGIDTIIATVTRTLGSNQENLTLSGTAAVNGTGNTLNNVLRGNAANNVLNGGAGADSMYGGLGNDTYYVDHGSDYVAESASAGIDTIISTVTRALGSNQENLTLSGTAAINGTGNTLNNVLNGNAANNVLDGGAGNDIISAGSGNDVIRGGLGADRLTGGSGNDSFAFAAVTETGLSSTTWDVITDFARGYDRINLAAIDANVATTTLNEAFRFIGSAAFSTNATGQLRYVYDSTKGAGILYGSTDADTAAEFAIQLTGVTTLATTDLVL